MNVEKYIPTITREGYNNKFLYEISKTLLLLFSI